MLAGGKFIPELHLRQSEFTYSACGPFTEHCQSIQKFREMGNLMFRNKLDKACFNHDAVYSGNTDLAKRTISDKVLKDRAYEIAKIPKYQRIIDGYQSGLAS